MVVNYLQIYNRKIHQKILTVKCLIDWVEIAKRGLKLSLSKWITIKVAAICKPIKAVIGFNLILGYYNSEKTTCMCNVSEMNPKTNNNGYCYKQ